MPKEPLTKDEQELVLKYAQEFDSKNGGWSDVSVYKTILFFLETGIHPESLSKKGNVNITKDKSEYKLSWKRTKKKGLDAVTVIHVPSKLESWIKDYLYTSILTDRRYYWEMCKDLRDYINIKMGDNVPITIKDLCPMMLRHTFAINRLNDGIDPYEIQQLMNCSMSTLRFYLRRRTSMLRRW